MTKKIPNAPVITPAKQETVLANPLTTSPLLEEHPTPVAIGAEAPPSVSMELSASGPFGAY